MKKTNLKVPGICLLTGLLTVPGLTWGDVESGQNERVQTGIMFKPGNVHEVCMALTPSEELQYSFIATGPLNFNLHYHVGDKLIFPVNEHQVQSKENSFVPTSDNTYCLMWTNKGSDTVDMNLEYEKITGN